MKTLYISRSKLSHSVNAVYVKGLRANGVSVDEVFIRRGEFWDLVKCLIRGRKKPYVIMVGYDSPVLAVIAKVFSGKRVIYNALCSVYERLIVSRNLAPKLSPKALYYWFIDFLAVHLSDLVMLETNNQVKYFKKLFFAPRHKLYRAWTGVDEDKFYYDPAVKKNDIFTAVFRGALMPEAGADCVVRAAKILENYPVQFIMASSGIELNKVKNLIDELKPKNLEFITDFLSDEDLRVLVQKSHLSLGQLADHPRLERTIPHKAYESLALKLPYLTAANKGVLELLVPSETCLVCKPGDEKSLAEAILWARDHPDELNKIAENSFHLYQNQLRPRILANKLLERVRAIKS